MDGLPIERIWLLLSKNSASWRAIRQYKKVFKKINLKKERGQDVKAELGDVFMYLFQLSFVLDIDLSMKCGTITSESSTQKICA